MRWSAQAIIWLTVLCALALPAGADELLPDRPQGPVIEKSMADDVKIYRGPFGTPHIHGKSDEATLFGFAYAQAEDNFWQLEDNYVLGLGRYSELHGPKGLNSDLLNRAFEIVPKAKANYAKLDADTRSLFDAFVAGLNYYLEQHPEVKPRLIARFEPWHVLAFGRHATLEMCYRYTRLTDIQLPRQHEQIWSASGSNAWAIAPQRTESGAAILLCNPHLPWFGFSTMYEAQLRSDEGWNFTGATFFGNPMLSFGRNDYLGWTVTTNEPDIADVWIEKFENPAEPLEYRYGEGHRQAVEWTETIHVKTASGTAPRQHTFRKTHHGPIVRKQDEDRFLSVRIAGLDDVVMLRQSMRLIRARSLSEFQAGLAMQQFPLMNIIYADIEGNIAYIYNGLIPKRDASFDWSRPVDGSNPQTEWEGFHAIEDLPQVINPTDGFVQNCNSSPFTTCDKGNPDRLRFPPYMCEDGDDDKRRAQLSRQLLREMEEVSFEDICASAFDTTMYWAQHSLPNYSERLENLKTTNPQLANQVEPYLKHLLDWDYRVTAESTQATLAANWYEELFGQGYPCETLLPKYAKNPEQEFRALVVAAARLTAIHGDWRVPWGNVFRIQRSPEVADILSLPFSDAEPSLPCVGAPGPMGVIFTQYYSPYVRIPFVRTLKHRYGLVGASYLAVYEFGKTPRGASAINFGESGNPDSAHYFDQAKLLSDRRLKPAYFAWPEVVSNCKLAYSPGAEIRPAIDKRASAD